MDVWDDETDRVVPRDDEGAACDAPPIAPPPTLGEQLCRLVWGVHTAPWHMLSAEVQAHYEQAAEELLDVVRKAHRDVVSSMQLRIDLLEAEIRGYQQARARGRARP
jgi:hypothetical protein